MFCICGLISRDAAATALVDPQMQAKKPKPYRNPTRGAEVIYQIRDMHRVRVRRNVAYTMAGGAALRMDVYRPRTGAGPFPTVLLGGPPDFNAGKDSGQKVGWAQLIAASGMAAVAFDIRSDNFQDTPAEPSADVAAAITYVRSHAAELGFDGERLCALGFSIGTAPWHLWATMREPQPYVRCNVVYYGPLDFEGKDWSIKKENVAEFSALTYLRAHQRSIPPMLIVKAGRDRFRAINASIDRFIAEAKGLNAPVQLLVHRTGPHGFDTSTRGARTIAIMKATLAFFRRHLLVT
jgi:acetyl esterase/lipase